MFENLRRDSARYANDGGWFTHPGFWVVATYRLGVWAHSLRNPLLRLPMWVVYRVLRFPCALWNVALWAGPDGARIGAGFCLIHPVNVYISHGVEIGEDCLIFHEVTLGTGPIPGRPKIGNHVDIYAGARLVGGVVVGDYAVVGPNCVVSRDVPAHSSVVVAQCRIIPHSMRAEAEPKARADDRDAEPILLSPSERRHHQGRDQG
ncbi:MAG TPA: serine acetyltransferase [Planctomycetota bacterium]|nr:serine acetyltransferase [Planctomycetota bacterium]